MPYAFLPVLLVYFRYIFLVMFLKDYILTLWQETKEGSKKK